MMQMNLPLVCGVMLALCALSQAQPPPPFPQMCVIETTSGLECGRSCSDVVSISDEVGVVAQFNFFNDPEEPYSSAQFIEYIALRACALDGVTINTCLCGKTCSEHYSITHGSMTTPISFCVPVGSLGIPSNVGPVQGSLRVQVDNIATDIKKSLEITIALIKHVIAVQTQALPNPTTRMETADIMALVERAEDQIEHVINAMDYFNSGVLSHVPIDVATMWNSLRALLELAEDNADLRGPQRLRNLLLSGPLTVLDLLNPVDLAKYIAELSALLGPEEVITTDMPYTTMTMMAGTMTPPTVGQTPSVLITNAPVPVTMPAPTPSVPVLIPAGTQPLTPATPAETPIDSVPARKRRAASDIVGAVYSMRENIRDLMPRLRRAENAYDGNLFGHVTPCVLLKDIIDALDYLTENFHVIRMDGDTMVRQAYNFQSLITHFENRIETEELPIGNQAMNLADDLLENNRDLVNALIGAAEGQQSSVFAELMGLQEDTISDIEDCFDQDSGPEGPFALRWARGPDGCPVAGPAMPLPTFNQNPAGINLFPGFPEFNPVAMIDTPTVPAKRGRKNRKRGKKNNAG